MKKSNSFRFEKDQRQYWVTLTIVLVLGAVFALGLLVYNNPVAVTSPSFWPVVQRRINAVIAMAIVALAQSLATVTFQSVTSNRIITPSILGFESLYTAIQTAVM
ncbi:MAG TPA: iron chelate uptake ABC transporter family permease subunit, partial [Erysipelothrix sp.]|nr:iron chelate uptake ABC transporter family permease subunit [Erysipelothrix sp.]